MSKRLRQNGALISYLMQDLSSPQLKALLETLTSEQVNALGEIAVNVLYGTITITDVHKKKLKRHAAVIELIGDKSVNITKRRSVISRNPRVIKSLLTAAKPILKGLIQP